jgi:predicted permease
MDVARALRALRRAPWYATTLAGVIALSIALSATVFAIVDGALFKPLPYREPDRLFAISLGHSALSEPLQSSRSISAAQLHAWKAELPGMLLTGWSSGRPQVVGVRDSVRNAEVDSAFFDVMGMRPLAGGFAASDFDVATPVRPALITQEFWQARFGRDADVIGRTLLDDTGRGIRIAGILPADFVFPRVADRRFQPELLLPRVDTTASLRVLVRLDSATREEAVGRLTAVAAQWAKDHPAPPAAPNVPARTRILRGPFDQVGLRAIGDELTDGIDDKAWLVFAVASALMLLASLNFTSLAIARIRDRWRDLAVRRALGARYADLVRLLVVENAVIVGAGTLAGIAAAHVLLPITLHLIGDAYMVVIKPPAIDARVLAFVALVAMTCVVGVTMFSARSAMRTDWTGALARAERGRLSIITFEVAVALVIAVGGSLLAGSLIRVWHEDPGFDVTNGAVITMVAPPGASAVDVEQLVANVSNLPGVLRAGGAANLILERTLYGSAFDDPPGFLEPPPESLGVESVAITHGYLEAAGLALRDGRGPTVAEFESGAPVVVVSESVAKSYWPGRRAIGQSLVTKRRPFTVVGVVPDARYLSLDRDPAGQIYWATAAASPPFLSNLLIRFAPDHGAPLAPTVAAITRLCPACRVVKGDMLADKLSESVRPRTFSAWLFSVFGGAALLIAGVGILGLVAMTTNRRTREIGIRMALGATASSMTRQIVREHVQSVVLGVIAGGIGAALVVRFVDSYLYKTPVYDPWSWAVATAALLLVSGLAAFIPSRRASRVDPIRALRVE